MGERKNAIIRICLSFGIKCAAQPGPVGLLYATAPALSTAGNCRFVKHIGQRTWVEKVIGEVSRASCWNGGCGRQAAWRIWPAFVVFPAGAADTVFFFVLHHRLTILHVLCYTFAHEEYGLLSESLVWQLNFNSWDPIPHIFLFNCPRCILALQFYSCGCPICTCNLRKVC